MHDQPRPRTLPYWPISAKKRSIFSSSLVSSFLPSAQTAPFHLVRPWLPVRNVGHAERQKIPEREQAYQLFRTSLGVVEEIRPASKRRNAAGERVNEDETRRRFGVVSPNVRNNNRTVSQWRQASLRCKAAFMGWGPDDKEHKQIGYKFANVVSLNDILLIARRQQWPSNARLALPYRMIPREAVSS